MVVSSALIRFAAFAKRAGISLQMGVEQGLSRPPVGTSIWGSLVGGVAGARCGQGLPQGRLSTSRLPLGRPPRRKATERGKTLREIGRLERTLFTLDWISDPALRRRTSAGLNKGEARNALARAIFFNRLKPSTSGGVAPSASGVRASPTARAAFRA